VALRGRAPAALEERAQPAARAVPLPRAAHPAAAARQETAARRAAPVRQVTPARQATPARRAPVDAPTPVPTPAVASAAHPISSASTRTEDPGRVASCARRTRPAEPRACAHASSTRDRAPTFRVRTMQHPEGSAPATTAWIDRLATSLPRWRAPKRDPRERSAALRGIRVRRRSQTRRARGVTACPAILCIRHHWHRSARLLRARGGSPSQPLGLLPDILEEIGERDPPDPPSTDVTAPAK
jgi:hypothetical protein